VSVWFLVRTMRPGNLAGSSPSAAFSPVASSRYRSSLPCQTSRSVMIAARHRPKLRASFSVQENIEAASWPCWKNLIHRLASPANHTDFRGPTHIAVCVQSRKAGSAQVVHYPNEFRDKHCVRRGEESARVKAVLMQLITESGLQIPLNNV
jgi:hypothetical protein